MSLMDILKERAKLAKAKTDWFHGKTNRHPHGTSFRFVIPYEWDRRCRDGGEWARLAGF